MARRWQATPIFPASLALHGASIAAMLAAPASWPWAVGALAANHALLTAAGLWPRSRLLGPNLVRLPPAARARRALALTIDDGPDPEVTPRVLDLLDADQARATFFCIGAAARRQPALCREIVKRGHAVENHTDAHAHAFATFGPRRLRRDLAAAQATLADITGRRPRFFRAVAGLRNPFLEPVLAELDLHLASWTRRAFDTRCGEPATVLARLTHGLAVGDILLLHDGHAARAAGEPVICAVLPDLLARCRAQRLQCLTLEEACHDT